MNQEGFSCQNSLYSADTVTIEKYNNQQGSSSSLSKEINQIFSTDKCLDALTTKGEKKKTKVSQSKCISKNSSEKTIQRDFGSHEHRINSRYRIRAIPAKRIIALQRKTCSDYRSKTRDKETDHNERCDDRVLIDSKNEKRISEKSYASSALLSELKKSVTELQRQQEKECSITNDMMTICSDFLEYFERTKISKPCETPKVVSILKRKSLPDSTNAFEKHLKKGITKCYLREGSEFNFRGKKERNINITPMA